MAQQAPDTKEVKAFSFESKRPQLTIEWPQKKGEASREIRFVGHEFHTDNKAIADFLMGLPRFGKAPGEGMFWEFQHRPKVGWERPRSKTQVKSGARGA